MTGPQISEVVARWAHLWNTDHRAMVTECYAPDTVAEAPGRSMAHGREQLMVIEDTLAEAAPRRRMEVFRTIVSGPDHVAIGVMRNPDQGEDHAVPFCIVLTLDDDGLIAHDQTYSDLTQWPTISAEAWRRRTAAGAQTFR